MSGLIRFARGICVVAGLLIVGYGLTLSPSGSQSRWLICLAVGGGLAAIGLWPRFDHHVEDDKRPAINVAASLMFIFAMLAVQLARVQLLRGRAIAGRSGIDPATGDAFSNARAVNAAITNRRGPIVDRNGEILAESVAERTLFRRYYTRPNASYLCGYFSPLKYGAEGIERHYDQLLSGEETGNSFTTELNRLLNRTPRGATVVLSIDLALQELAHELLGDRTGAVVLIETSTGAVRALASTPHHDPNQLVAVDFESAIAATSYWEDLTADASRPLLSRSTTGLYTPGSTFKTVTLAAAVDSGVADPADLYIDDGSLIVDGHLIVENNRPDDSMSEWTLEEGLAYSLNVVFAQVGLQLGPDRLWNYAERFGFGSDIPFDIEVARGQIAKDREFLDSQAALADTAFGQGQLLTTPLGMALVAAGIANGGEIMRPYLVHEVVDAGGSRVQRADQNVWRRPVTAETAAIVRDTMVNAVVNGYASQAAIDGLQVGGKTGTAETGTTDPHAWFIGFAGDPEPSHAVAVVLEYGGSGASAPMLIAREMLAAATFDQQ
jgi:penicillin-binding protein A